MPLPISTAIISWQLAADSIQQELHNPEANSKWRVAGCQFPDSSEGPSWTSWTSWTCYWVRDLAHLFDWRDPILSLLSNAGSYAANVGPPWFVLGPSFLSRSLDSGRTDGDRGIASDWRLGRQENGLLR